MDDVSVEGISKILRDLGYQKHGNECMYNGHTGRPFDSLIFLGPTFYQVLSPLCSLLLAAGDLGLIILLSTNLWLVLYFTSLHGYISFSVRIFAFLSPYLYHVIYFHQFFIISLCTLRFLQLISTSTPSSFFLLSYISDSLYLSLFFFPPSFHL